MSSCNRMKLLCALVIFHQLLAFTSGIHFFELDKIPYIENLESKIPHYYGPEREDKRRSPVILIPGDGGSRIDAMLDKPEVVHYICDKHTSMFYDIWLNKELLVWWIIDCSMDNLRLVYNNETRTTSNAPGVTLRIPGWGYSEDVEWIDTSHASVSSYYANVANALSLNGYHRGISIRGAPYDFRKAPNENEMFPVKMKKLVEEAYEINGKTPVTLIAHSMGGPMTLNFLQRQSQEWKDKYIRRLISIAGAWGGSVKSMKIYAAGDNLGSYFVSASAIRTMQVTTPSLAWLMPNPLFWKPNDVLARTKSRTYTVGQLEEFLDDMDLPESKEMYKDVLPIALNFTPPGVEVHCLYGSQKDTVESLEWPSTYDMSGTPTLVYGEGDGTVNLRSLEACKHWIGQQKQPVYVREYPGNDHLGILADLKVLDDIVKIQLKDIR
ncbi:phospholipase A2 group XV-like [Uranotaenia lowii]|uniref:phospholipase A2 group XV-like n=1 Tax=Uranotaenia lowii TaxID=190385 RepID=UPI00247A60A1|nr:phospholipase A2 group XV-like [Uranotaenia lowii]